MQVDSTLVSERRAFLGRLRSDPLFALKHLPALAQAVARRVRTVVSLRLAAPHRARKTWPDWLEGSAAPVGQLSATDWRLPVYPPFTGLPIEAQTGVLPAGFPAAAAQDHADPEDVFASHRWGFLLTSVLGEPPAGSVALDECRQWIANNRDRSGPAWEPYSACERVANLLTFLAVNGAAMSAPRDNAELVGFVHDSMGWIHRHLEYYGASALFNHILNNARALLMSGAAVGEEWAFAAGVRIFQRCLPELITPQGFLRERSSHYQLVVLNWVLDALQFCAAHRGAQSPEAQFLHGYAARMVSAAALLCDVPGPALTIGDVSPDASPERTTSRLARLYPQWWPPRAVGRPAVQQLDGWIRIAFQEETLIAHFPSGTYPFPFVTHGHCDLTSFVWRHGASEVLADCGRYRYTPDDLSLSQKSAIGHNLPLVNGLAPLCETLLMNGHWWPLPYARAELAAFERNGGIALIHTGYARATPVTRHERRITPHEMGILVVDSFEGSGRIELTLCWQFGEQFDRFETQELVATGAGARVALTVDGVVGPATVQSLFGGEPGAWVSREYGHKRPALAVRLRWPVDLPAVISTRFRFTPCAAS